MKNCNEIIKKVCDKFEKLSEVDKRRVKTIGHDFEEDGKLNESQIKILEEILNKKKL